MIPKFRLTPHGTRPGSFASFAQKFDTISSRYVAHLMPMASQQALENQE
ncbi:MAG: hypothetical protein KF884_07725 [Fimbriimonadaceae bacterium]|nr:hypothetical protein [Fimbriimonadaceae bacterium]QYK57439.1 MAG: hypothetical protein KF884_07725 [Fimbriimonadaceae bacterium]